VNALEATFVAERPRLVGVAYRITGSIADAEDVVQEAWLRLQRTDGSAVRDPTGWLITVVSRLALDDLKRAYRSRESYVGPWLPEPVPTPAAHADPQVAAELSESLTLAFLQLLDALSPPERVAFLLADVFATPYEVIGQVLDRSPAACRQLASRARRRLAAEGVPPRPDGSLDGRAFVDAVLAGDIDRLTAMLAPDVVLVSDGGSRQRAARRPIVGAERAARYLTNLARRFQSLPFEPAAVNDSEGFTVAVDGHVLAVGTVDIADGRVTAMRFVVNPDKLRRFTSHPELI